MKRFLIITSVMMVLVLALAVAAFVYVQLALAPETVEEEAVMTPVMTAPREVSPSAATPSAEGDAATPTPAPTPATTPVPAVTEPIPLSALPLSDTQKELLRGAGIDTETFVITPEMIACAEDRLGAARFSEIIAGAAPGATEMFSLLRCL